MKKRIVLWVVLIGVLFASCQAIQYKKEIKKSYPTLGALGIFENYIAQEITQEKSVVDLSMPVRLKIETVSETPRDIFKKNDTSLIIREYITLEVLDA